MRVAVVVLVAMLVASCSSQRKRQTVDTAIDFRAATAAVTFSTDSLVRRLTFSADSAVVTTRRPADSAEVSVKVYRPRVREAAERRVSHATAAAAAVRDSMTVHTEKQAVREPGLSATRWHWVLLILILIIIIRKTCRH